MKIRELFALTGPHVSFEFFPPPTETAEATLFRDVVPALKQLQPRFFSVTYGAGGGTRDNTIRIVDRIRKEHGVEAMAHLTCVGHTQEVLGEILDQIQGLGIDNILCLRGDPPKGQTKFVATEGGFANAIDLIRFVRKRSNIGIGAACYPEGHVECSDRQLDWDRAAAKVEAGADFLITQLFYDLDPFYEMEDYLVNKKGVKVPIIPGILPILNTAQIKRFTALCGAHIPPDLMARLEEHAADDQAVRQIGVDHATEMCTRLIAHGSEGVHFYCLNRVASSSEVIKNLQLPTA